MTDKISGLNWFTNKSVDAITPDLINKVLYGYGTDDDTASDIGTDTDIDDEAVIEDNTTNETNTDNTTTSANGTQAAGETTTETPQEPAYTEEEKEQLVNQLEQYIDQYLEVACEGLSIEEAAAFSEYMSGLTEEFAENYLNSKSGSAVNLDDAIEEYQQFIINEAAQWRAGNETASGTMSSLLNSTPDELYNNLIDEVEKALEGNNRIGTMEAETLKDLTADYLISTMLNGSTDTSLLKGINSAYSLDSDYLNLLSIVNKLKTETDAQTQLQLLNEAKEAFDAFVEKGQNMNNLKDTLIDGIEVRDTARAAEEKEQLREDILPMVDEYMEAYIQENPDLSEEEINQIYEYLKSSLDEFLDSEVSGEEKAGRMDTRLIVFLDGKIEQQQEVAAMLEELKANPTEKFDKMQALADEVMDDKFVSGVEKDELVDKTSDFLINQLLNDADCSDLLKNISSKYSSNEDYQNAVALVKQLKVSTNPDEMQELYDEAKASMSKFLDNYKGTALAKAIQASGPIEIDDTQKDRIMLNSTIAADYEANKSRSLGGRIATKDKMSRMEEVQAMAREDLNAVATALKEDLKEQLGSNYDEAKVSQWIINATNDTIALFTENNYEHDCSGDYNVPNDSQAFVWNYRGSIKKHKNEKGRWSYNVQALTNTFIEKFNESAKLNYTTGTDPSQNTYDKENVITNSVGNDYYLNKSYSNEDKSALFNQINSTLTSVSSALRTSLGAQGIDIEDINTIIDDSIAETLDDVTINIRNKTMFRNRSYSYNTVNLVDTFLAKVEEKAGLVKQIEEEDENQ